MNNARQGELNHLCIEALVCFNVIFINPKTFKKLSKWFVISTLSTHGLCPMLGSFQELWKINGIPCLSVLYLPCDRKRSVFKL